MYKLDRYQFRSEKKNANTKTLNQLVYQINQVNTVKSTTPFRI